MEFSFIHYKLKLQPWGVFETLKKDIDIQKIYNDYLVDKSETRRKEIGKLKKNKKKTYRASSAGMCARKIYYETIMKLKPTEEINEKTRRIFRIGDLIHTDIQAAIIKWFKDKNEQ